MRAHAVFKIGSVSLLYFIFHDLARGKGVFDHKRPPRRAAFCSGISSGTGGNVPDVPGIVADRTVRGKDAGTGDVDQRHLAPALAVSVSFSSII